MTKHLFWMLLFPLLAAAQYEPERYLGNSFAMEDMSNPYGPPTLGANQMGIYFWRPPDEWYFTSTMNRVSDQASVNGNGYVSFVSSHIAKSYHPVGVSFGQDANGNKFSIDMSAPYGDTVWVEIENVSNQDLSIRIALKDVNENLVDTKPGTNPSRPWEGVIEMLLPKNSTKQQAFVYQGGFYGLYDNSKIANCNVFNNPSSPAVPCGVQKTDFTKIAGANITINSSDPENVGITNAEIRIHKMRFGSMPLTLFIGNDTSQNHVILSSLNVFPNPAGTGTLNLNIAAHQVKIFDSTGNLLCEFNESESVDIRNFPPGIYVLHCLEGNKIFEKR